MNLTYDTLHPVPPAPPTSHSARELRTHQGIPGIERLAGGRLLATWYCGGTCECRENYCVLAVSDDDGLSWQEVPAVIDPPSPDVRAFDPTLWLAPNGTLYWFWAQGCGGSDGVVNQVDEVFDGLEGVWSVTILNPEAPVEDFRFSAPRRVANGIMLNKPTVLADGAWALPCSLWSIASPHRVFHASLNPIYGAMMVVSVDQGSTFAIRGTLDVTTLNAPPSFDEHQFLELADGRIACYVRCQEGIGRSLSCDGGVTWEPLEIVETFCRDCRFHIRRLHSGRILLLANNGGKVREKLTAFLSEDEGQTWAWQLLLDSRKGVSYPDAIQAADGSIFLTYDYNRFQGGYLYLSKITEEDILNGQLGQTSFLQREISHSHPVHPVD